jgi:hypothetical protein
MRETFLPAYGSGLGIKAAIGTEPRALGGVEDRWCVPRFVAGRDWTTDDGLRRVLEL